MNAITAAQKAYIADMTYMLADTYLADPYCTKRAIAAADTAWTYRENETWFPEALTSFTEDKLAAREQGKRFKAAWLARRDVQIASARAMVARVDELTTAEASELIDILKGI